MPRAQKVQVCHSHFQSMALVDCFFVFPFDFSLTCVNVAKSIDFHSSEGQSMIIPPTSGSISFLPNSELHFTDPGIYYVYCQVYISDMVGNTVEVCLQQDSNQVAVGVVAKNTSPRTVSLGRLICVKTSASTISVKIQPQNKASVIVDGNGLRTYLGAFLVHNQTSCG